MLLELPLLLISFKASLLLLLNLIILSPLLLSLLLLLLLLLVILMILWWEWDILLAVAMSFFLIFFKFFLNFNGDCLVACLNCLVCWIKEQQQQHVVLNKSCIVLPSVEWYYILNNSSAIISIRYPGIILLSIKWYIIVLYWY